MFKIVICSSNVYKYTLQTKTIQLRNSQLKMFFILARFIQIQKLKSLFNKRLRSCQFDIQNKIQSRSLLNFKMDFLREIVGGPKNRYKENGYNLDLTYITPRIIAMAFPGSGLEKLYRNNIDTIAQLLETEHNGKYITVNMSGRSVDEHVLKNVVSYAWEDHKAPPFDMLFTICDEVSRFLSEDEQRIAVFHCNHGKGRTGTIICCFFLFMGIFQDYREVMKFYAKRRFEKDGYGVTQPCQIKYIEYFQQYLANSKVYPQVLFIKKITFKGDFDISSPYVKLINNSTAKTIYNTRQLENSLQLEKDKQYTIKLNKKHFFAGDITLQIKDNRSVGKNLLISYVFNTAFVNVNRQEPELFRQTVVPLRQMSPLGKQKQKNLGSDFQIDIDFRRLCDCGDTKNILGCHRCGGILKDQFEKWQRINIANKNRELLLPNRLIICGMHNFNGFE